MDPIIKPGPAPSRGGTSHPCTIRLTDAELAEARELPGVDLGSKIRGAIRWRYLVQIGDIAVSPNCDRDQIAALTEALTAPFVGQE